MLVAGIDIGSTITKIVISNHSEILASVIQRTGAEHRRRAHRVMDQALAKAGMLADDLDYIVTTGYGRINVPFADAQVTEITCHMRGVSWLSPDVRTIIDIGGQDCKGIKVKDGRLEDFVMNDKCAAGTGRFFEIIAKVLGVDVEQIGPLSLTSKNPAEISNLCTVFAEQEALYRLSEGVPIADIAAGIHKANASRIYGMVRKIKIEQPVAITGGGAKNTGLCHSLQERLQLPVFIPPEPLITGALGAALIAGEKAARVGAQELSVLKKNRRWDAATFFNDHETRAAAQMKN
ncbi:2-hydroxyglutaryl-CoA dehydratase [Desulfosarcina ovata subsp. sediminis]|uniref:2-hydroxyglutaryl-CoA dehydratase n=1 Tax=Desulfosarcina ovata subsp. sediminis TaxID=885957 RepID=A0A5K7ZPZ5_9BACT|nr:acyl-CoA dehydratase activase [Desulfosarcina ovata]BBO82049.1 2-hydroxyglutaryl-CoA dehydratase [Desulfosarcina ovata subsp. sediminis]